MIQFNNISNELPFVVFKNKYDEALSRNQSNPESVCISSYCIKHSEVNSRYVNCKILDSNKFIFFSNYKSPKAHEFSVHKQVSAVFYWNSINTQIRIKALIEKTNKRFNENYFKNRSTKKNALAICSKQSQPIKSFNDVVKKYEKSLSNDNLLKCPEYWGGYEFTPYEMEFWEGNANRLNKRNLYKKNNLTWDHFVLEP
jgi:pyridoxamine 5'-phosphate oxidase